MLLCTLHLKNGAWSNRKLLIYKAYCETEPVITKNKASQKHYQRMRLHWVWPYYCIRIILLPFSGSSSSPSSSFPSQSSSASDPLLPEDDEPLPLDDEPPLPEPLPLEPPLDEPLEELPDELPEDSLEPLLLLFHFRSPLLAMPAVLLSSPESSSMMVCQLNGLQWMAVERMAVDAVEWMALLNTVALHLLIDNDLLHGTLHTTDAIIHAFQWMAVEWMEVDAVEWMTLLNTLHHL